MPVQTLLLDATMVNALTCVNRGIFHFTTFKCGSLNIFQNTHTEMAP